MRSLLLLGVLFPLACRTSTPAGLDCAEPGTSQGVGLAIADAKTGATFPFSDIVATAVDGSFRDSLSIPAIVASGDEKVLWLAPDREGTYAVTVRAKGYSPWSQNGVVVSRSDCKLVPVVLAVRLQPAQ